MSQPMALQARDGFSMHRLISRRRDFALTCSVKVKQCHNLTTGQLHTNSWMQDSKHDGLLPSVFNLRRNFKYPAFKSFSSTSFLCQNIEKEVKKEKSRNEASQSDDAVPDKPLSQRQKLARIFAAYGTTGVVFHTCISLASLGMCYMIVSSGIDMVSLLEKVGIASEAGLQSTLASGASTFVIAYACHKVFMPVRIFLTITCTPIIVSKLKKIGILKDKVKLTKATSE